MSADLTHLRATLTEHGSLDKSTVLALIDRAEKAERQSAHATSALKALADRNIELTEFKDAYALQAQELEQAEQPVARVRAVCGSEAYEVSNEFGDYDAVAVENIIDALDGDNRG